MYRLTTQLFTILLGCLTLTVYGQNPSTQWVQPFMESGNYFGPTPASVANYVKTIAATSDGVISLFSGKGSGLSTSRAGVAINKYSLDGKQVWKYNLYTCYSDEQNVGRIACTTPPLPEYDFITTLSGGAVAFGPRLVYLKNTGEVAWELPITKIKKVIQLTHGDLIVVDSLSNFYKLDSNGIQAWKMSFGVVSDVQATNGNTFILTGPQGTKLVSLMGQVLWTNPLVADNIRQTQDGNYLAWGTNSLHKINNAAQTEWSGSYGGISSLVTTKDNGCVMVLGNQSIAKLSSAGTTEWKQLRSETLSVYSGDEENVLVMRTKLAPTSLGSQLFIDQVSIKTGLAVTKTLTIPTLLSAGLVSLPDGGIAVKATTLALPNVTSFVFKLASVNERCNYQANLSTSATCESTGGMLYAVLGNSTLTTTGFFNLTPNLINYQWKKNGSAIIGQTGSEFNATEPGTYSIVISQEGCLAESKLIQIGKPQQPTVSADRNSICDGQSVVLKATGCSGSVKWSTGETGEQLTVTPEKTTSYTATCEVGSCVSSNSNLATVIVSPKLSISITAPTTVICSGNQLTLTANLTGATPPFGIQWRKDGQNTGNNQNTLTISEAGSYSVILSNSSGCSASSAIVTITKSDLSTEIKTDKTEFCRGGNASLTATLKGGIAPFTYQWRNGTNNTGTNSGLINTTSGGVYSLTVSDSKGCTSQSNSITLTERGSDIIASISAVGPTEVFAPARVTLNASTGLGYTYQWQKESQNIAGATTPSYEVSSSGDYSVLISRDGCIVPSASIKITINQPTAINPSPNTSKLKIFPNPANHQFVAEYTDTAPISAEFQLTDMSGRVFQSWTSTGKKEHHRIEGNVKELSSGNYLLRVITPNGKESIHFIKQ